MSTDTWIWKIGQVGVERRARLSDADGRIDLSTFDSVTVTFSRTAKSAPIIDRAACVPDVNQSEENELDGKGWLTFTTDEASGNIPVSSIGYVLEFECLQGDVPFYFPMNADGAKTYGKLIVQRAL